MFRRSVPSKAVEEGEQVGVCVPVSQPEASVGAALQGRPRPARPPVLRGRRPQGSEGRPSPTAAQGGRAALPVSCVFPQTALKPG